MTWHVSAASNLSLDSNSSWLDKKHSRLHPSLTSPISYLLALSVGKELSSPIFLELFDKLPCLGSLVGYKPYPCLHPS